MVAPLAIQLSALGTALLDLVLPPRCLGCEGPVATAGGLCGPCWGRLTFLSGPGCAHCSLPWEMPQPEGTVCGACLADPPAFTRGVAALRYDDAARPLVLGLKHADRLHALRALGPMLAAAASPLVTAETLIVPVPLHRWRLWRRRANQSALLARAVAERLGAVWAPDLLVRRRATRSQGELGRQARRANVAGAFAVRPRRRTLLKGRPVLLVDDVWTTGATLSACARALWRGGAGRVDAAALARVVPNGRHDHMNLVPFSAET